jgi:hypothetical protein
MHKERQQRCCRGGTSIAGIFIVLVAVAAATVVATLPLNTSCCVQDARVGIPVTSCIRKEHEEQRQRRIHRDRRRYRLRHERIARRCQLVRTPMTRCSTR